MKKTFILDTNILLNSPYIITSLDDNDVVIPNTTIEELDTFKSAPGELGFNSRETIRILSGLRGKGNMRDGVELPGGGKLRIEYNQVDTPLPEGWKKDKPDNRIIQVCLGLQSKSNQKCILITNDINMQIKADIAGIEVQDFKENQVSEETLRFKGKQELYVKANKINDFYQKGSLILDDLYDESVCLELNEFVLLRDATNLKSSALGRYNGSIIEKLKYEGEKPFDVVPRNASQRFAQEALLTPAEQIPLVILKGPAGTAKTFYSLAAGLEQVINRGLYKKVLVCRPNVKFDEDIGYLPGTETEKIGPLMRPIFDNLSILLDMHKDYEKDGVKVKESPIDELFERGYIVAEAMAYMRGRSINDTYIIVDEAQNATPNQITGLVTRCGMGSKIILCGDPDQIDTTKLDKRNNGLVYASEKMKGSSLCMQITFDFEECVRSPLAQEAADRLVINKA